MAYISSVNVYVHVAFDISESYVVVGDFNINVHDLSNREASESLMSFIGLAFSLTQHVGQPTHKHGHTLDLVITKSSKCCDPRC